MPYKTHCVCKHSPEWTKTTKMWIYMVLGKPPCTRTHTREEPLMAATTSNVSSNFLTDNEVWYFIHVLLTFCALRLRNQQRKTKDRKRECTQQQEHLSYERKYTGCSWNTFTYIVAFLYLRNGSRWMLRLLVVAYC